MMDTVLNLGLNDETVKALAKASGSERFAYDSYRRFLQMFSDVVLGADLDLYEEALDNMKKSKGYKSDTDLTADDLKELVKEYKEIGKKSVKLFRKILGNSCGQVSAPYSVHGCRLAPLLTVN